MLDLRSISRYESMRFMIHNHYIMSGHLGPATAVGGNGRNSFRRFTVVCKNIERAIELCKKQHPGIVIDSIAHQGQIEVVEIT